MMIDQGLSGVTNLGMTITVAQTTEPAAFGVFAVTYGTYILILSASTGLSSEVLVIRYSAMTPGRMGGVVGEATGTAIALGVVAGVGLALASVLLGGLAGSALLPLAAALPALLLQNCWRFVFFAQGRPRAAAANDFVWCLAQAVAFTFVLTRPGIPAVSSLVFAWGFGACVGAVFGAAQAGVLPRPLMARSWLRKNGDLAPQLAADALAVSGGMQVTYYALAFVASLSQVGGLRAAETLIGPLGIVLIAAQTFSIPEGVRLKAAAPARLVLAAAAFAVALVVASAVYSGVLLAVPPEIGEAVLKRNWEIARDILPFYVCFLLVRSATVAPTVGLRVLEEPRRILRARAISLPLLIGGGVTGAAIGGGAGAAVGLAVAQAVGAYVWWRSFVIAHGEHRSRATSVGDS
jgi:hypothetical protein